MTTVANRIIDAFGGSTALSQKSKVPLSTVHSWRKNGIPGGRQGHLELLASCEGKSIDWDTGRLVASDSDAGDHDGSGTGRSDRASSGKSEEVSATQVAA